MNPAWKMRGSRSANRLRDSPVRVALAESENRKKAPYGDSTRTRYARAPGTGAHARRSVSRSREKMTVDATGWNAVLVPPGTVTCPVTTCWSGVSTRSVSRVPGTMRSPLRGRVPGRKPAFSARFSKR